jgi:hypothetical protein
MRVEEYETRIGTRQRHPAGEGETEQKCLWHLTAAKKRCTESDPKPRSFLCLHLLSHPSPSLLGGTSQSQGWSSLSSCCPRCHSTLETPRHVISSQASFSLVKLTVKINHCTSGNAPGEVVPSDSKECAVVNICY